MPPRAPVPLACVASPVRAMAPHELWPPFRPCGLQPGPCRYSQEIIIFKLHHWRLTPILHAPLRWPAIPRTQGSTQAEPELKYHLTIRPGWRQKKICWSFVLSRMLPCNNWLLWNISWFCKVHIVNRAKPITFKPPMDLFHVNASFEAFIHK